MAVADSDIHLKDPGRAENIDNLIIENQRKFATRIEIYQRKGYDIPAIRKKMVQFLSVLPNDATILDLGCGKGHLALAIARSGKKCITVDISADEIHFARLNAMFFKLDDRIDFQLQDARQLPYDSESFDAVVSAAFFHHLDDPEPVLNEMLRVCKSPGKIILSDLNQHGQRAVAELFQEEGRVHGMTGWLMAQIKDWFEKKGFQPVMVEAMGETIIDVEIG